MSAAVDTHAHIFVPDMPWHPVRRYTPDYAATIETYTDVYGAQQHAPLLDVDIPI